MKNQFADRIYFLEKELLDLKTASAYTSLRSVNLKTAASVSTGLYQITYGEGESPIFAMAYVALSSFNRCAIRTAQGNTQIVEVNTTKWDNNTQSYQTFTNQLIVVSNRPILGITRLN